MVISAHPDDMEIGMGGTVAKMAELGTFVSSVVLTDGRRSANPFSWTEDEMARVRKEEAKKAAAILGINEIIFFGLPELETESGNYQLAKQKLRELITQLRPDEIYTPHSDLDKHPTHQQAGQLVIECWRELRSVSQAKVWAYEVWGLFSTWDRFEPIDGQIGKKLLALSEHRSQIASIPYGEGIIGLNRWRAVFADPHQEKPKAAFAEVFISV